MKLHELTTALKSHPEKGLRFVLPDGDLIPENFHVTEVGHVGKRFIDCGGTVRTTATCMLQAWVAENDQQHRLTAGKLASILEIASKLDLPADLDVEVEYERCVISQFPLVGVEVSAAELTFSLGEKHTDCLAREACGLELSCCGSAEGKCC